TVATETTAEERGSQSLINTLYEKIEGIECPDFFLSLDVSGLPNSPPPSRKWKQQIQAWVSSLNYDEVLEVGSAGRFDELPSLELSHDGLELRVEPIAKKETARGRPGVRPIGAQMSEACFVTSRFKIRDKVKEKAVSYGKLQTPYVVVVNC